MRRVTAILIRCEVTQTNEDGKQEGRGLTQEVAIQEAAFTPELMAALRGCGVNIADAATAE